MKYNIDSGKISISPKELVSLTRRGISPIPPRDEDEPTGGSVSERMRKRLLGEKRTYDLSYSFEIGGSSFELLGTPDEIDGADITLLHSRFGKIRKEDLAQARGEGFIFGYMLMKTASLSSVKLKNIFINEKDGSLEQSEEYIKEKKLSEFFEKCRCALSIYGKPEVERVTKRLPTLRNMKFPYKNIREGQGEFIRAVYRALASGSRLYACAPTGTGKTVSVIYPALKGLADGRYDKIFYLTPKTTTREAAKECLYLLQQEGACVRGIAVNAKERMCKNRLICRDDRRLCQNSKCNKLPDAIMELYSLGKTVIDRDDIDRIAPKYSVCPYELELAYSELCDIIICDFNYVFDPQAYIRRYFEQGGNYALLVDESHNLVERAREMYSCEMSMDDLKALSCSPLLGEHSKFKARISEITGQIEKILYPYVKDELHENNKGEKLGAAALSDIPTDLYALFDELEEITEQQLYLTHKTDSEHHRELTRILKEFHRIFSKANKTLQIFDKSFKLFVFYNSGKMQIKFFCLDTGGVISQRLDKCHSAVFFSATLSPIEYYKALLGGDRTSGTIEVASPFASEQLSVSIVDKISTRYSERERTIPAVCRTIAAVLSARRGNYMVFSPSFEYSEELATAFKAKYPKITVLTQHQNMSEAEKEEFLSKFKNPEGRYLVGFCVMGGIYSEGIDLAGDSLIGAVVVGIGIPALSYEREAMAEYFEERYEAGKQYAYVYPGMNRVFQAAGRVIRREEDRGVIVLIDDRFADPIYKKSIPALWRGMRYIGDAKELKERIESFWRDVDGER